MNSSKQNHVLLNVSSILAGCVRSQSLVLLHIKD